MAAGQLTSRRALFGGALGIAALASAPLADAGALTVRQRTGKVLMTPGQVTASETLRVAAWAWIRRFEAKGGTLHVSHDGTTVWIGAFADAEINLTEIEREIRGALKEEIKRQVRVEHRAGLRGVA